MTPKKLTLKGFKGVRSGFGSDEIVLDLDALAGDAQQIAIVGPNGAGKSTLLDNLHPYRLMPSRAGRPSPDAFSFWGHVYGPEALKELDWAHGGMHYRSTLVFKSTGKTKKAEAYLHVLQDGQWAPARLADGTVSDGKSETYDRLVEGILGMPETFFTSQFAAQGRKPLSAHTAGEIKTLLADLLGHERVREIGAKAAQVAKLLVAALEGMRSGMANVLAAEEGLPALKLELERLSAQDAKEAQLRRDAQQAITKAQAELTALKAARVAAGVGTKRREELSQRLTALRKASSERRAQVEADVRRETERVGQSEADRQRQEREAQKRIGALEELGAKRRAVLARKDEIAEAANELTRLSGEEKTLTERLTEQRKSEADASVWRTERARSSGGLQSLAEQIKAQASLCEGLKKRAGLASQVPCEGTELQPRCPLLRDALDAKGSLAGREQELADLRERQRGAAQEIETLDGKLAAFPQLENAIRDTETALERVRQRSREQRSLAGMAAQLADAEEAIQTFDEQAAELRTSITEREAGHAKLLQESEKTLAGLKQRLVVFGDELRQAEEQIAGDIAKLPPAFDDRKLGAAELAFELAEREPVTIDLRIEQTRTELAGVKAKSDAAKAQIAAGEAAKEKVARLELEVAQWTVLAKAFSTNGIVALSIDDAGPALTGLVNDLLLACYGNRFSVSIKTQAETAKGELREGFEILVHDAERDEAKAVEDMSGGERVWINEALTRGIALYLARESEHRYETLFSDEADGPLDPEKKLQFMRMKREVLKLGGYTREYFVSQSPELWALADARIELAAL